jgi:hypothetical protein
MSILAVVFLAISRVAPDGSHAVLQAASRQPGHCKVDGELRHAPGPALVTNPYLLRPTPQGARYEKGENQDRRRFLGDLGKQS